MERLRDIEKKYWYTDLPAIGRYVEGMAFKFKENEVQFKEMTRTSEVIDEKIFENHSDEAQRKNFTFTHPLGKTKSVTTAVNFRHAFNHKVQAGANIDGFVVHVSFEKGETWAQGIDKDESEAVEHSVLVPPHSTMKVKAVLHSIDAIIPYEA